MHLLRNKVVKTVLLSIFLSQATAERVMGGGNSDSELKLKNRCTGSTRICHQNSTDAVLTVIMTTLNFYLNNIDLS